MRRTSSTLASAPARASEDGAKRIVVVLDWFEELKRLVPKGS